MKNKILYIKNETNIFSREDIEKIFINNLHPYSSNLKKLNIL